MCCMICSLFLEASSWCKGTVVLQYAAKWSWTNSYFLVKGNSCLEWSRILDLSAFRICLMGIFFFANVKIVLFWNNLKKLNLHLKLVSHIFWKTLVLMLCMVLTTNMHCMTLCHLLKNSKNCKWKEQFFLYNLGDQESCCLEGILTLQLLKWKAVETSFLKWSSGFYWQ